MAKKMNTKDLVQKIEKLTRERMAKERVVSLADLRELKKNQETPRTLLVIEDDETMRNAMKRIFESEGHRVKSAADGTQLSAVLDDSPIDLIVLDVGLPWINGLELAKLLKEHEDLKEIPLIFVTGKAGDLDVKRGFDAGCDDYITKPFEVEKIKKTVATLLKLNR